MKNVAGKMLNRRHATLFLVLICACSSLGYGGDFEIAVFGFPDEVLPGMLIEVNIEIRNVSGHRLTLGPRWDVQVEIHDQLGAVVAPCPLLAFTDLIELEPADWKGKEIPADWRSSRRQAFCFQTPGKYFSRFFVSSRGPFQNRDGEFYEAWEGEVATPSLKTVVLPPQGVDREVFEAFDADSLALGEHQGDLLRRFPTSTYAAYVVWELGAKGILTMDLDRTVRYLNGRVERMWASIPFGDDWQSLKGSEFLNWRDSGFEQVLETHPDIWFAGELRYVLALDDYLLGDKASCAARLEDLSEHAKPYVAENAQALLKAMKAKGMLPGGTKSPAAQEKETTASGSTAK